jgi:hypothetical protein
MKKVFVVKSSSKDVEDFQFKHWSNRGVFSTEFKADEYIRQQHQYHKELGCGELLVHKYDISTEYNFNFTAISGNRYNIRYILEGFDLNQPR